MTNGAAVLFMPTAYQNTAIYFGDTPLGDTRRDRRPQLSPVSADVDQQGRIVVSTYPQRAKTINTHRDPEVSICVLCGDFDGSECTCTGRPRCSTCLKPLSPSSATSVVSPASTRTGRRQAGDGRPGQVADPDHAHELGPGGYRWHPAQGRRAHQLRSPVLSIDGRSRCRPT